ncbi:MAG TPA: DUF6101 family protein [Xanthobacteraceae bacterium]|nr:DUF6101 family protein [Xanthobacteraceae bacterium]
MRRQTTFGGALSVGSSRALRLDPLALPLNFTAADARADERVRHVELSRERVVLRRAVRGIRMAVNVPVSAFLGVALRLVPAADEGPDTVAVSLEHRDPALSVPLYVAAHSDDVVAEWQLWARVFALPLLVADPAGALREPFRRIGAVRVAAAAPRRRRRNAIKARRPAILLRRRPGIMPELPVVHRGEREIIARN